MFSLLPCGLKHTPFFLLENYSTVFSLKIGYFCVSVPFVHILPYIVLGVGPPLYDHRQKVDLNLCAFSYICSIETSSSIEYWLVMIFKHKRGEILKYIGLGLPRMVEQKLNC